MKEKRTTDKHDSVEFRELRGNYQHLALRVLDHALRDATNARETPKELQKAALQFIFSKEAEFWAEASGMDIRKLREAYQKRMNQD